MIKVSFSIAVVLILSFCQVRQDQLLTKGRVGELSIGDPIDDIYAVYGKENTNIVDTYIDATFSPAIEVLSKNQLQFQANIDCDLIYTFQIFSAYFETESGLRVGSSFEELNNTHSISSIETTGEGVFVIVDDLAMSFRLSLEELAQHGVNVGFGADINASQIPAKTKVESIIVF